MSATITGWTDTHCHIHDDKMSSVPAESLQRARDAGVERFVVIGTDAPTCEQAIAIASQHADVWATVGLHPHDATQGTDSILPYVTQPRVVAVGEAPSGGAPVLVQAVLKTESRVGIAQAFVGLEMRGVKTRVDPQAIGFKAKSRISLGSSAQQKQAGYQDVFHGSERFENLTRGGDSVGDVFVTVGTGHKARFVQSGCNVDPAIEQAVEQGVEFCALGFHDLAVVLR